MVLIARCNPSSPLPRNEVNRKYSLDEAFRWAKKVANRISGQAPRCKIFQIAVLMFCRSLEGTTKKVNRSMRSGYVRQADPANHDETDPTPITAGAPVGQTPRARNRLTRGVCQRQAGQIGGGIIQGKRNPERQRRSGRWIVLADGTESGTVGRGRLAVDFSPSF